MGGASGRSSQAVMPPPLEQIEVHVSARLTIWRRRCASAWPQPDEGADWPSGNAPTTGVRRLIARMMRSSGLLVQMRRQCAPENHLDALQTARLEAFH